MDQGTAEMGYYKSRYILAGVSSIFAIIASRESQSQENISPVQSENVGDATSTGAANERNASEPESVGLLPGEIVVTANKREQRFSDVGLAITAISGDLLKQQNLSSLSDIAATIPGLSFTPSSTSTPVYTLRGVGFYENSLAAYPTSSVYLDEVPLSFPVLSSHAAFDLERVEVLKGPQGTLFGQNSTGGAINFIAAKPTTHFEAGGDVSYGRFNRVEGNLYISGSLSDTLRGRIALTGARADNWQYSYNDHAPAGMTEGVVSNPGQPSYAIGHETIGKTRHFGGRALLDWTPTDRLTVRLGFDGWRDKSDPQVPQYQTLLSQIPATTPQPLRDFPFAPDKARAAEWSPDRAPHRDNRMFLGSMRVDWQFNDNIQLTSLSSYADYKQNAGYESDGTIFYSNDFYLSDGRIKTFSQELRLSNSAESQLRWIIGANFERSNVSENQENAWGYSATGIAVGANPFNPDGDPTSTVSINNKTAQRMRNMAAFANAEYDINDQITLKAGVRYTDARRRVHECNSDAISNERQPGSFWSVMAAVSTAYQLGFIPVPGLTPVTTPVFHPICTAIDDVTIDGTPATYQLVDYRSKLSEDNLSWRLGIDYKARPGLLLYANIARGYKAGSFPVASASTASQFNPVTQEQLTDFEGGFKADLLDRMLQLNGAAFYYQYKDKQLRSKLLDPVFGLLDQLVNIPKSRIVGAELEVVLRPVTGLIFSAAGGILDSEVTRFTGLNTIGQPFDFSGATIPYTPKYQLRLTGDYSWEVSNLQPFMGVSVAMRSHANANIGGPVSIVPTDDFASSRPFEDTFRINGYTTVDLRAGIGDIDGDWKFTVFGKNIFNKFYLTNIYNNYDTIARFTGQPVTYGATLSIKMK